MSVPGQQKRHDSLAQQIATLAKVPDSKRAQHAQIQLAARYPHLLDAFRRIPRERHRHSILFVSFGPHSRETRLAAAARLAGWDTFAVTRGMPSYDAARFFSFHACIDDLISLVLASWAFPGALVHAFVLKGDHAALIAMLKPRRLVLDLYDLCADWTTQPQINKDQERSAIATADGLVHRDLRIKHLQRTCGYQLPAHNILIHDPLPTVGTQKRQTTGEIHVVSTGWIGTGANSIVRLARALCASGVHVHVYFSLLQQQQSANTAPYRELQRESPFFHLEQPISGDLYLEAIARYDFGIAVSEPGIFGEPLQEFTPRAIAGCGSSRLCDYLAADIGVISSPQMRFQYFWARRFAACVVPTTREFIANPRPLLEAALRARRSKDRSAISVQGVSRRLGDFYHRVAELSHPASTRLPKTLVPA